MEPRRNHASRERFAEAKPAFALVARGRNHMEPRRNHARTERFAKAKRAGANTCALQEPRGTTQEPRYFQGSFKRNTYLGMPPGH